MIELKNCDCLEYMKTLPNKAFHLAIVDPPYGIKADKNSIRRKERDKRINTWCNNYTLKNWDVKPSQEYFNELFRISKYQIIWGGNYFMDCIAQSSSCWLVWDKLNGSYSYADCELAWTNYKTAVRKFEYLWSGFCQQDMKNKEIRFHPTQKPVALYKWILSNYNKDNLPVFDSHLGSGSIAIACHDYKIPLVGCEIDQEYFNLASERLANHQCQLALF